MLKCLKNRVVFIPPLLAHPPTFTSHILNGFILVRCRFPRTKLSQLFKEIYAKTAHKLKTAGGTGKVLKSLFYCNKIYICVCVFIFFRIFFCPILSFHHFLHIVWYSDFDEKQFQTEQFDCLLGSKFICVLLCFGLMIMVSGNKYISK